MVNSKLLNTDRYEEIQYLDELLRELQDETLNENWGQWYFALLNLKEGEGLLGRIYNTLIDIPEYKDPYRIDTRTGSRTYKSYLDPQNLVLETVEDLRNEIITQAEHWAYYQGPGTDKQSLGERFESLKYEVADKMLQFLQSKEIKAAKLIKGVNTYYSFGFDHCGEEILIDTQAGVYLIHFGFSS